MTDDQQWQAPDAPRTPPPSEPFAPPTPPPPSADSRARSEWAPPTAPGAPPVPPAGEAAPTPGTAPQAPAADAPASGSAPVPPPPGPAPQGYAPPSAYGPSQAYGPPQGYGPPQAQAVPQRPFAPAGPAASQGWTPPPKPGLIPLRPLTLGTVLGASFMVMRRNPKPTFGFALLLVGLTTLLSLVAAGGVLLLTTSRIAQAGTAEDAEAISAGGIAGIFLSLLVPLVISLIATAVLQGVISLEVARGTLGERLRMRGLWRLARGRIGALIGWVLLVTAAVTVATVVVVAIAAGLAALGDPGAGLAVLLVVLALLGATVVGVWLGVRLAFVASAIVLERLPIREAVRRSWRLTHGYFWRTFGILLLVYAIYSVASQVVVTPITFIGSFIVSLSSVGSDPESLFIGIAILYGIIIIVSVVVGAVGTVIQSAAAALLYIDLRIRKEGLDLELARTVEQRQAGLTPPDPYLPQGAATQADGGPWA